MQIQKINSILKLEIKFQGSNISFFLYILVTESIFINLNKLQCRLFNMIFYVYEIYYKTCCTMIRLNFFFFLQNTKMS